MTNENSEDMEVVSLTSLESITKAEVDCQISTAHKFPRSMAQFKKRATEMATLDEETAASCIYSRPVGGGKFAEGLSVRMAEIVGAAYGNLRVGSILVEQTTRYVKARGFAHDLESNFASTSEVIESTVKKDGTPYDERMRIVIAKSALAKARRDATFTVVPKALCRPIENEARKVAVGDASTLAARRSQVMAWIGKLGIDQKRVFAALKIEGENDIGLDELATLTGLKTSIKDGEVTVDEAFPSKTPEIKPDGTAQRREPIDLTKTAETPEKTAQQAKEEKPAAVVDEPVKEPRKPHANIVDELDALVAENGITDKDFMNYCEAKELLSGGKLSTKMITSLVNNWQVTLADFNSFFKA